MVTTDVVYFGIKRVLQSKVCSICNYVSEIEHLRTQNKRETSLERTTTSMTIDGHRGSIHSSTRDTRNRPSNASEFFPLFSR